VPYDLANPAIAPTDGDAQVCGRLLTKEVRRKGDWAIKRPGVEPSGVLRIRQPSFYPDIDDTAQVAARVESRASVERSDHEPAFAVAVNWLIAIAIARRRLAASMSINNGIR